LIMAVMMVLGITGCGKNEEVVALEELIASIGEVTIDSEFEIMKARDLYESLDNKCKEQVENFAILEEAEVSLKKIKEEIAAAEAAAAEAAKTSWEIDYFVDDFGEKTEDGYIMGEFHGTFDNTAGKGMDLVVYLYYNQYSNESNFAFRLGEYGRTVATYVSNDLMSLNMKIGEIEYTTELFGTPPNGDLVFYPTLDGRSLLEESYYIMSDTREDVWTAFIDALNAGETIPCYTIIGDGEDHLNRALSGVGGTKYSFKIEGRGFSEQVELLGK